MQILPADTVATVTSSLGGVLSANISVLIGLTVFVGGVTFILKKFDKKAKLK